MPLIMALGAILAPIVTAIGRILSIELLKWVAFRALMIFLIFVALPVVLYNTFTDLIFDFMEIALDYLTSQGISSYTLQITGIGAYIASKIQLVQAVSLYMSFVSIRFLMRFIPFFK
jgi:hypothetical protein